MSKKKSGLYPIYFRITKEEKERLREAQKKRGFLTLAEYARITLKQAADEALGT